jgi:hypothetical protein
MDDNRNRTSGGTGQHLEAGQHQEGITQQRYNSGSGTTSWTGHHKGQENTENDNTVKTI